MKNPKQILYGLLAVAALALLIPLTAWAAPASQTTACAETYTVQADDWLSKIADKFLGNALSYPAIAAATNEAHAGDASFTEITNPDVIEVGWQVCIPSAEQAQALLTSSASPAATALEPAQLTVAVTDAMTRSIQFDQPPTQIAVAGKGIFMVADALYMFPEAKTRVTTLPRGGQSTGDFLALADPGYDKKTFIESDAGPEQIAAAKPDAVVLKSITAEKLGRPLEQLGLPVVYVNLETPEQFFKDITTLGQLFGNPAQAKTITTFYQSRLDRVSQALQGVAEDQKPRVLVLQYSDKGGAVAFNVPPANWIQTTMVSMAGGRPVWTEASQGNGWTVVNFEQIAAWDPDKILVINYFSDVKATVAKLKADPQWQGLKAVQAGQLYAFPKDYYSWDQPDTRWILGLTWLAKTIHPDRFADLDLTQEINGFYQQLYGLDETAIKDNILPLLTGDVK